jgi:hypothetical protein
MTTEGYSIRKLFGRCANGAERDQGTRWHLIPTPKPNEYTIYGPALCGAKPGRTANGFNHYDGEKVTCPKCLKKVWKT